MDISLLKASSQNYLCYVWLKLTVPTFQSFRIFFDKWDHCWWNHHCSDAILSHALKLLVFVRKSEVTNFESCWLIQMFWKPRFFFEITFRRMTLMWDDAQVSECWVKDERKGGWCITHHLQFHYLILFIPSMTRKTGLRIHRDKLL